MVTPFITRSLSSLVIPQQMFLTLYKNQEATIHLLQHHLQKSQNHMKMLADKKIT